MHNEVIISQGWALIILRQYKSTCLNLHEAVGIAKCHQRFQVNEYFAEGITCITEHFSVINSKGGIWSCKRCAQVTTGWSVMELKFRLESGTHLFANAAFSVTR